MSEDPDRLEEEEAHPDDPDSGGDESLEEVAPAPPFTLGGNEGLGNQWMMVGDKEIAERFGAATFEGLRQGRTRWAARFTGEGLDGPSADPLKTAALLRRVAITARWIANGLFPGHRQLPGFVVVQAEHSIVLQFALSPDERPLAIREFADEGAEEVRDARKDAETRSIYPTVEGGRYFATLLASIENGDELVQRLQPVGKQAVLTYQGALKEFVEYEAEVDLLVPSIEPDGKAVLRRVNNPPSRSQEGLIVLNRVPEEVSSTIELEGLLYTQNSLKNEFGIAPDHGPHVTGEYDIGVADKLGPAWNKRVWARIEQIGPSEDWMPRAGRVRRVLRDVVVLRKGQSRLG